MGGSKFSMCFASGDNYANLAGLLKPLTPSIFLSMAGFKMVAYQMFVNNGKKDEFERHVSLKSQELTRRTISRLVWKYDTEQ